MLGSTSTGEGVIGKAPTALVDVAVVVYVAVMSSPTTTPVSVPVRAGFGSPNARLAFFAVTVSAAFATVTLAAASAGRYNGLVPSYVVVAVTGTLCP